MLWIGQTTERNASCKFVFQPDVRWAQSRLDSKLRKNYKINFNCAQVLIRFLLNLLNLLMKSSTINHWINLQSLAQWQSDKINQNSHFPARFVQWTVSRTRSSLLFILISILISSAEQERRSSKRFDLFSQF